MRKLLEISLGILTAIGGMIDIGNLVANPQAGARFGMSLAWVVLVGRRWRSGCGSWSGGCGSR
jgi:hypothetical protein